jgi:hypothetical protein
MVNIISEVNTFLLKRLTPYASIIQNVFLNQGTEEIICRQEPSSVETRYLDGKRMGIINFAYYTKSIDQKKAREQLDSSINALDFQEMTEITDGLFVKVEVVSLPHYISKTDNGEHIFTSSFRLEYLNN